jgi:hypothetical protein
LGASSSGCSDKRRYFNLYFVSVIAAAIVQLIFSALAGGDPYPTVGASGGVFGLLLAYGMYFPRRMLILLFPPIPMPAWLFVTLVRPARTLFRRHRHRGRRRPFRAPGRHARGVAHHPALARRPALRPALTLSAGLAQVIGLPLFVLSG